MRRCRRRTRVLLCSWMRVGMIGGVHSHRWMTAQFQQLKAIVSQKNQMIGDLRARLSRYEPDDDDVPLEQED